MRWTTRFAVPVVVFVLAGGIAACSDDSADSEVTISSSLPESVATPTGPTETVPQSAPSDSTTTVEPVSSGLDEVFDFATDALCDRISGQRVAEIVETAFRAHDATPVPSGFDDEGRDDSSPYRYCGWVFEGGEVGLVATEPAEEARSQWSFVAHPALSPGVMVSEERLGYIGESGDFISGFEVRLLVEGQDSTVEFWHSVPVGYTGDESALLAVADGLLREMGWVPAGAVEVFSFATHDLCDWISTDDLAKYISAEFDWAGTVEMRKVQTEPSPESCEWVLRGEASDPLGDLYLTRSAEGAYGGRVAYGEQADLGTWVVGHPALDAPALTATSGFGGVAYGFPDDQRIITMWLEVPGYEPDADFFMAEAAVANQILHDLGWFTTDSD